MELNSRYAAIDSCIMMRLIQHDNPAQVRAVTELLLNGQLFYVDGVAIMEVVHVLTREHTPRDEILDSLEVFLRNPMIIYDREFFEPVFKNYLAHPSLSFDDCVLAARAEKKGYLPLWTFDRKLAKQAQGARLLEVAG